LSDKLAYLGSGLAFRNMILSLKVFCPTSKENRLWWIR